MKDLSIIIIHYKKPALLKLCLKSLFRTIKDVDFEVIVVDSATEDTTRDMVLDEFPQVKFLPYTVNTGYSKGVNAGLENASGQYYMVMNPDVIFYDNSIKKMLDYLKANKNVGIIGPALYNFNDTLQNSCFRYYSPMTIVARRTFLGRLPIFNRLINHFLMSDEKLDQPLETDWLMGSVMMLSSNAMQKIGPMDENFFMYFEDVDWCKRSWDNHLSVVYYPHAKAYHYHQRKSKRGLGLLDPFVQKETRWHLLSAAKFFIKHGFNVKKHTT